MGFPFWMNHWALHKATTVRFLGGGSSIPTHLWLHWGPSASSPASEHPYNRHFSRWHIAMLSTAQNRPQCWENKKIPTLLLNSGFRADTSVIFYVVLWPEGVLMRGLKGCSEGALPPPAEQRSANITSRWRWLSHACVSSAYLVCISTANLPWEIVEFWDKMFRIPFLASVSYPNGPKNNSYCIAALFLWVWSILLLLALSKLPL